jgi:NADH-quinone oxidoreductase subunit M
VIIEALIAIALLGAAVVLLGSDEYAHQLALAVSALPLVGSVYAYLTLSPGGNALLAEDDGSRNVVAETTVEWITLGTEATTQYQISWHVGLDGISLPLLVLTALLTTVAIASAKSSIDERQSQFYALVLLLEAALIGVFSALDFFLYFVFWEAVLVPMYLLIGIWGGPRRKYAAIKFFVYTNVASLVMFAGIMALVFDTGLTSFSMIEMAEEFSSLEPRTLTTLAFVATFAGFGVKVPIVPFHTWLPDAHVEAPTPVSVLLAGVLLKMGTYALLRFNFTMLPNLVSEYAVPIAAIAVISVLYGALLALAQQDLKRIVAYSSVSSMGYVILGLVAYTVYGVGGATFQMVAHGLISGLLFMTVGVIYNATHTRMVTDMAGVADRMPITAGIFVAGAFGYMGLPLMAGFAAEYFIFYGSFTAKFASAPLFTAAAMFGIVIVAGYLLFAMQRTLFGPFRLETDYELEQAPVRDVAPMAVLLAAIVVLGVDPGIFFEMIQDATQPIVENGGGA